MHYTKNDRITLGLFFPCKLSLMFHPLMVSLENTLASFMKWCTCKAILNDRKNQKSRY